MSTEYNGQHFSDLKIIRPVLVRLPLLKVPRLPETWYKRKDNENAKEYHAALQQKNEKIKVNEIIIIIIIIGFSVKEAGRPLGATRN